MTITKDKDGKVEANAGKQALDAARVASGFSLTKGVHISDGFSAALKNTFAKEFTEKKEGALYNAVKVIAAIENVRENNLLADFALAYVDSLTSVNAAVNLSATAALVFALNAVGVTTFGTIPIGGMFPFALLGLAAVEYGASRVKYNAKKLYQNSRPRSSQRDESIGDVAPVDLIQV